MGFIATKPFMLNNITTEIRKPNGKLATNLSGRSTIIFRIDRRTPQPLPMNISQGGGGGSVKRTAEPTNKLSIIEKQIRELTERTVQEERIQVEEEEEEIIPVVDDIEDIMEEQDRRRMERSRRPRVERRERQQRFIMPESQAQGGGSALPPAPAPAEEEEEEGVRSGTIARTKTE